MSLVLVTGSTDGIGLETARRLLATGHDVVAHARFRVLDAHPQASDVALQDRLLERLADLTGVTLPV